MLLSLLMLLLCCHSSFLKGVFLSLQAIGRCSLGFTCHWVEGKATDAIGTAGTNTERETERGIRD